MWENETIPDLDRVFCFIHIEANVNQKTGKPRAAAFHNTPKQGNNLSCDWSKYATPEETKARIGLQYKSGTTTFKNPDLFGVVAFEVGTLRTEDYNQQIEHDPIFNNSAIEGIPNNRAHSIIIGEKDEEIRLKMVEIANWIIPPVV